MAQANNILRPLPQRTWQITPASSDPPSPAPPNPDAQEEATKEEEFPPSRTRSIMNLTSSTLFGIYSSNTPDGGSQEISRVNTPWGTGAMTPITPETPGQTWARDRQFPTIGLSEGSRSRPTPHARRRPLFSGTILPLTLRSSLLFLSGLVYGLMVTYLNDNETLLPVRLEIIHRHTWQYLVFWGCSGVAMGNMLPWFDVLFEDAKLADGGLDQQEPGINRAEMEKRKNPAKARREFVVEAVNEDGQAIWFPAVRGIGVFIGICFAIRKLPWESTLQAILTLVLVNPVLWYIIDRSRPGFIISVLASLAGTALFMVVDSMLMPLSAGPISTDILQSDSLVASGEVVAVFTWLASVIFCSSVCFRNIGKMLAFQGKKR